jgi:hypothetical protein
VIWAYLASIAILLGGEFNVAVRARCALRRARRQDGGDRLGGGDVPAPPERKFVRTGGDDEAVALGPGERQRD